MDINNICTFIMPFRIDSADRLRNLIFTLSWLTKIKARILLLEADVRPHVGKTDFHENVGYMFVEDHNPTFHRTHYINMLLNISSTEIVSVWDADVVIAHQQIVEAIENIIDGCTLSYPYSGEYIMLNQDLSKALISSGDLTSLDEQELRSVFNRPFCGGAFFVNRQKYLSLGGENERFIGWGPEDAERLRRVQIMGYQAKWTKTGKAYHLYHPRKENSNYSDQTAAIEMRSELVRVCRMDREELAEYIKSFKN